MKAKKRLLARMEGYPVMSERAFMDHFQQHVPFLLTLVVTLTRQSYPGVLLSKGQLLSLMYDILLWSGNSGRVWASVQQVPAQRAALVSLNRQRGFEESKERCQSTDIKSLKYKLHLCLLALTNRVEIYILLKFCSRYRNQLWSLQSQLSTRKKEVKKIASKY